jgi:hypothetical protein
MSCTCGGVILRAVLQYGDGFGGHLYGDHGQGVCLGSWPVVVAYGFGEAVRGALILGAGPPRVVVFGDTQGAGEWAACFGHVLTVTAAGWGAG